MSKIVGFTWWTRTIAVRDEHNKADYGLTHDDSEEKLLLPSRAELSRVN